MIRLAVERPAVVWATCIALLVAGALALVRLPLATRTTVELPRLMISAGLAGASPEVIETYITSPIESAVQGVRGVRRVNSNSNDGAATLAVELDESADVQMTRLAILERLELLRGEFPPAVYGPSVANYVPEGLEEAPLLSLTVFGPYTPAALQQLLNERVSPRLGSVPGVAGVQVRGGTSRGVSVSYDATMLRRVGIAPQLLADAVNSARVVQSLGVQQNGSTVRNVVLRDQPNALVDLAALPVRGPGGRVFTLGQLATIRADEDTRGQFFRIDGAPAVAVDITRHPGADAIRTAALLRAAIAELATGMPPAVRLRVSNDTSEDLACELRDLGVRGAIAFGAVLVVLLVMLRDWRAVALVMFSTAVAIAGTALSLYLLDIPANLLTLAGLGMGIGVLVQNALVVVQRLAASRRADAHASHQRDANVREVRVQDARGQEARGREVRGQEARGREAYVQETRLQEPQIQVAHVQVAQVQVAQVQEAWVRDAEQIAPAVIGSTLTTAVVLFPFLYLQGNARAAFVPFSAAFAIALVWSVLAALLVVPALGVRLATNTHRRSRIARVYRTIIARTLRWRVATLTIAAAAVGVLAWGFIVKVPRSSFGGLDERRTTLSVGLSFPRGSDPQTLDAAMRDFEQLSTGRPEVEQVRASSRGTAAAQMLVTFTRSGGYTAVPAELQELLTQRAVLVGGANVSVFGEGPGFSSSSGGGSMSTFRLTLLGYSYDGVGRIANDVKARLERIPRVRDVRISAGGYFGGDRSYQITLAPERAAMARYGVSASQLAASFAREVRGPAGRQLVEIAGDELPVTLKTVGARDRSIGELQDAIVPTHSGAPVRIGDLSVSNELEALSTIQRQDQQYVLQVAYDFRGPAKLARRTHNAFVKTLAAPPGYSIANVTEHVGDDADATEQNLYLVFAMGLALVLLAVALVFDSVWSAMMVLVSLPLSLAGVAAAFWFTGTAFTREAAVGVILVVGLAVNHAILVIDAAHRKRRVRTLSAGDVLRAMHDRAGMIVCVTLASLASLAPLSVGTDATRLFGAIALATAGGTIAGTLGVLFVLPAMLVERRAKPPRSRILPSKY